ncbi:hypothetical protein TDB9533_02921 [Thalassocella blandensis]|nr:hypothetical protein TDB9533_02921 [Thalassocella blandensis]
MGKQFTEISDKHQVFIQQQKLFFVATAAADSRVNVSPKGMDTLKVLSPNRVIWLNVTGSGNETAAHVQVSPRMTIMFAAFEGNPLILRLYGQAKVVHRYDEAWATLSSHFTLLPGARQIFDVNIDYVQQSCGMSVPFFSYQGERDQLIEWAEKKGPEKIEEYWQQKNQFSLDGLPTQIFPANDDRHNETS